MLIFCNHHNVMLSSFSEWAVQVKSDSSPLTIADSKANALICSELNRITPHIPIVSEETKLVSYATRSSYKLWWCVDPLDGTKEFIKRNGQVRASGAGTNCYLKAEFMSAIVRLS